jgi:uncharacterized repeat protein (TIGR02543 family)
MKKTIFLLAMLLLSFGLIACDDEAMFLVSFETNGGSTMPSFRFDGQSELLIPDNPIKEGYLFDGWYMDKDLTIPLDPTSFLDKPIDKNIKLYAKWILSIEDIFVKVIFNPLNHDESHEIEVVVGSKLDIPVFLFEGHEIEGWYFSDDEGQTFLEKWDFEVDTVIEDMTLYAKWDIQKYTVIFLDGDLEIQQDIVDYGQAAIAPNTPNKEGHTFIGWDTDFTNVTEHLFVKAMYM